VDGRWLDHTCAGFAPPTTAASAPEPASASKATPLTTAIRAPVGASSTATTGSSAPTTKLTAEYAAACSGRARSVSVSPNSSRACAANTSPAVSSTATWRAVGADRPRSR